MKPGLPILALLAWPMAAAAEVVPIRSGEHPGFSRLVLEFGERPAWSLTQGERRAAIAFGPGERSFDPRAVFERIPRTRIRDIAASPDGLELELGCDCRVTAFEIRDAALVIDVADAEAGPGDLTNVTPTASDGARAAAPPPVAPAPQPISTPDAAQGEALADAPDAPGPGRPPPATLPAPPEPDAAPLDANREDAPGQVLSDLTEAIARATTQGNLRLAETPPAAGSAPPEAFEADPAATNLRLRLPGEEAWLPEEPPAGSDCRDPASFDVAAWVPAEGTPADAIAALRASLATDLEAIDEERAVALARLYVGIGFGAEARAVLSALAPRHPESGLLEEMARIVDGEPAAGGILAAGAECPGRAQLWSALATGDMTDPRDVIVAIGELPIALRRQLAPRVMSDLAARGDDMSAEAVRGTIERAGGPHGADFAIATVRIAAARDPSPDLAPLRDIAGDRSPSADEALAALLEIAEEKGEVLDGETLSQAEMRAGDLRGTALGTRLETGLIRAHIRGAAFAPAASRFAQVVAEDLLPPESEAALARDFFSALGARGPDEDVLVHAAQFAGPVSDLVRDDPSGAATAARLLDLGLPELAVRYLPRVPGDPASLKLAARARLLAADPGGALALLAGVDPRDPAVARLLAEASLSADPEGDEDLGTARGPTAASDGPIPQAPPPTAPAPTGDPGTARAFVEASEAARQRVETLLSSAPAP